MDVIQDICTYYNLIHDNDPDVHARDLTYWIAAARRAHAVAWLHEIMLKLSCNSNTADKLRWQHGQMDQKMLAAGSRQQVVKSLMSALLGSDAARRHHRSRPYRVQNAFLPVPTAPACWVAEGHPDPPGTSGLGSWRCPCC